MKTHLFGADIESARSLCAGYEFFEFGDAEPELIIAYGGDGTLLQAEYKFPGVPKLLLKNSSHAYKAHRDTNESVLARVSEGNFEIVEHYKLEVGSKETTLYALNDIVVHNADPRHGLRYTIRVDTQAIGDEIIGDGVVVSSPFGSSGYYRSITDSTFEIGIGLAFNNSTEQRDHMVLREDRIISISILRGPAICYADNQKEYLSIKEGESINIKKSKKNARILRVT